MRKSDLPQEVIDKLDTILHDNESVEFVSKGRVEFKKTSILGSFLFWIKYIFLNYIFIVISCLYRQKAYLIATSNRIVILTDEGVNFPLWVIPFSRENEIYIYPFTNISSVMGRVSQTWWVFFAKGFEIESTGSRLITFNGVTNQDYKEGLRIFNDKVLI